MIILSKLENFPSLSNANFLKFLSTYISRSLANIFNKVFETEIYPDHYKKAEIIPVYENDRSNELISNFAKFSKN